MKKKILSYCFALTIVAACTACNSNNHSKNSKDTTLSNKNKDKENKEEMMPDSTVNLLEYDSTKTKTGR